MQATHLLGEMSGRRDFFYLVGTWESDNKYSKRYSSWFLACSCSRELRFNWKKFCFFIQYIQYRILQKTQSEFIMVYQCMTLHPLLRICVLFLSSWFFKYFTGLPIVESDSVFVGQDCCNCIPSWDLVGKHSELLNCDEDHRKLSMLVWYQNDGFIWLLYNMFWKAVVL